ncbi:alpha/beta fold hydrolase [Streptacidiphilus griseoplanus]|uniref:alpha/beta fold hydrolase n=1 Tax=Peterkaempfera griseoplana TaxID=66896 RepID=UPI0007C7F903|nr:alpha/beta hydrolase [Peterkaempfera griseoplana]
MTDTAPPRTVFRTAEAAAAFSAAYDAALAQWPVTPEALDLPGDLGTTRVHRCGPADGPPLVLLPGGGATSAVWAANVRALARTHRIHALDLMGDVGRSVHDGRALRGACDLVHWLDQVLDRLGLDRTHLCGHSYGAWIALRYALHAPARIGGLALLEPTACFTGLRPGYLLHALPLLRPTAERLRAFYRWETRGAELEPTWLELAARGAEDFRRTKVVMMRRPRAAELRTLTAPTLVLTAERSRAHDIGRLAAQVRRLLPHAESAVLPDTSHHSVPLRHPGELDGRLLDFLGRTPLAGTPLAAPAPDPAGDAGGVRGS